MTPQPSRSLLVSANLNPIWYSIDVAVRRHDQ
ncbi:hypothetical protein CARG_02930 [Corynebacterium argentoratense DSM 44202]|uniref:Uncharacterized protein n=1 Tax=Corynebacterium argentoratense DSM 44202 TaxID=1348662 RepID=U3GWA4_9CORY|nr:hypothetical protein CARG_02930 [Corynebacterium argentoratense DSM 44202]